MLVLHPYCSVGYIQLEYIFKLAQCAMYSEAAKYAEKAWKEGLGCRKNVLFMLAGMYMKLKQWDKLLHLYKQYPLDYVKEVVVKAGLIK